MVEKADFFEDVAVALDFWTNAANDAAANPRSDLSWVDNEEPYLELRSALEKAGTSPFAIHQVFAECFRGFAVSILTILDGGTALAEKGRVYLVDERGKRLGEGLHDGLVRHLMDTGRLK